MPDFVRLPDGSLVLRAQSPQVHPPSFWAGMKAALSRFMPANYSRPAPSGVPWWMQQQQQQQAAPVAAPQPAAAGAWGDIEEQTNREQAIADQLGDFSRRVLANKALIGG